MTPQQRELIRHAIGADSRVHPAGWRNFYEAGVPDLAAWLDLVDRGSATPDPALGMPWFRVTEAGFHAVGEVWRSAMLSEDRLHRFELRRTWGTMQRDEHPGKPLAVIGLNPSTADEIEDDQTIRRCMQYARRNGHSGLIMVNLYSLRTKSPAVLMAARPEERTRPENMESVRSACVEARRVLVAWGGKMPPDGMPEHALALARLSAAEVVFLGFTKDGAPRHPSRGAYRPFQAYP